MVPVQICANRLAEPAGGNPAGAKISAPQGVRETVFWVAVCRLVPGTLPAVRAAAAADCANAFPGCGARGRAEGGEEEHGRSKRSEIIDATDRLPHNGVAVLRRDFGEGTTRAAPTLPSPTWKRSLTLTRPPRTYFRRLRSPPLPLTFVGLAALLENQVQ